MEQVLPLPRGWAGRGTLRRIGRPPPRSVASVTLPQGGPHEHGRLRLAGREEAPR